MAEAAAWAWGDDMSQETANFFELIRREGLIVVALAALVWQVYWTTTTSAAQDRLWREEIKAYREAADARAHSRLQASADIAAVITKMSDRIAAVERVISDAEEECQLFQRGTSE
mgnify:FL=1